MMSLGGSPQTFLGNIMVHGIWGDPVKENEELCAIGISGKWAKKCLGEYGLYGNHLPYMWNAHWISTKFCKVGLPKKTAKFFLFYSNDNYGL